MSLIVHPDSAVWGTAFSFVKQLVWVKDLEGMPGISTVDVISQRPSSMFGAEKEKLAENNNNNAAMIHILLFIMCSLLSDPEL
jgi:hypothetical protein